MTFSQSHILLPVDFSGYSQASFKVALQIASRADARITLLHVIQPPYNFAGNISEMNEELEKHAQTRFDYLVNESEEFSMDIQVDKIVTTGMPVDKILEQIRKNEVNLVVMGSKGKSGLEKAMFGSIAENVMYHAPVPVMVVPEGKKTPDFTKILFATDYRSGDLENLDKTIALARLFYSDIDVLHVAEKDDFETRIKHRGFISLYNENGGYEKLQFNLVLNRDLHEGISEYIAENPTSLIVMNRYKKKVLQSLFKKDHTKRTGARLPMLILPAEWEKS